MYVRARSGSLSVSTKSGCVAILLLGLVPSAGVGGDPADGANSGEERLQRNSSVVQNQLTIDQLIDALGSPDYQERERASDVLKSKNRAFTEDLKRVYVAVGDHEIRLRLLEIAEFLFYRDALREVGGFLGIEMQRISPVAARGSTRLEGVRIRRVFPGTGAERAGLQAGDIVTRIDDQEVRGDDTAGVNEAFSRAIGSSPPGHELRLTIQRDRAQLTKRVTLGPKPLPFIRDQLQAGRLGPDQQMEIDRAEKDFARWCAELDIAAP